MFFFLRNDTSLLRAACWTMVSGMRLANHVKFQCGEIRKFDWCCEILSEAGAPCGSRFQSKRALRCHQLRSHLHGHGRQTSVFSSVITNHCPWCRSTFSTTLIARKHAAASMLSGHCLVDAGAFPWPISPSVSLQCSLCDDETDFTSIDELYDHSVAVHLPKPSPVSLPIASVAKSFSVSVDASTARGNNAGSGGCPDGGRREETQTDSAQVGGWRTWFSNAKQGDRSRSARRSDLPRGLEKEARRHLQKHHTADGHHHQAVSEDRTGNEVTVRSHLRLDHHGNEHDVVKSMREQTRRCNEGVQAAGKGHTLGPPQIWAWGGLIAGLQKQEAAANAATPDNLQRYSRRSKSIRKSFCIEVEESDNPG